MKKLVIVILVFIIAIQGCTLNNRNNYSGIEKNNEKIVMGNAINDDTSSAIEVEKELTNRLTEIVSKYYDNFQNRNYEVSYYMLLDKEKEIKSFDEYANKREDAEYATTKKLINIFYELQDKYVTFNINKIEIIDENKAKFEVEETQIDGTKIYKLFSRAIFKQDLAKMDEIYNELLLSNDIPLRKEVKDGIVLIENDRGYIDFGWYEEEQKVKENALLYKDNIQLLISDDWVSIYDESAYIDYYIINTGLQAIQNVKSRIKLYNDLGEIIYDELGYISCHAGDEGNIMYPNYIASGIVSIEEDILKSWNREYAIDIERLEFYDNNDKINDCSNSVVIDSHEIDQYDSSAYISGYVKNISDKTINKILVRIVYKNTNGIAIAEKSENAFDDDSYSSELSIANNETAKFNFSAPDYLFLDEIDWDGDYDLFISFVE